VLAIYRSLKEILFKASLNKDSKHKSQNWKGIEASSFTIPVSILIVVKYYTINFTINILM